MSDSATTEIAVSTEFEVVVEQSLRCGHPPRIMLVMSGYERVILGVLAAYGALAVVLLVGCHRSISGAYLASDKSAVVWLQVVRTPDNHLTGQIAATALKPNGSIEQNSASVIGVVDGENVTIQGSRFFGLESFVLSGTLNGNVLTLTGAQSVPLSFTRSTPAEFQAKVAELNARSQTISQAKAAAQTQLRTLEAQRKYVAEIDLLVGRMQQFDSQADVHLGRFPAAEKGYEGITAKVAAYVARERQLAGNPNGAAARGQLSVAANQASIQTEQMHNQGESLLSSLKMDVKPMADESATLAQQCRALSQNTGSLTRAEVQNVNAACVRLESAVTPSGRNSVPCQPVSLTLSRSTSGNGTRNRGLSRNPRGWINGLGDVTPTDLLKMRFSDGSECLTCTHVQSRGAIT